MERAPSPEGTPPRGTATQQIGPPGGPGPGATQLEAACFAAVTSVLGTQLHMNQGSASAEPKSASLQKAGLWEMRPRPRLQGPTGHGTTGRRPAGFRACSVALLSCSTGCTGLGAQHPRVPWPGRAFHALPSHWGPPCPSAKGQPSTSALALDVAVSSAPLLWPQQLPSHGPASSLAGSVLAGRTVGFRCSSTSCLPALGHRRGRVALGFQGPPEPSHPGKSSLKGTNTLLTQLRR